MSVGNEEKVILFCNIVGFWNVVINFWKVYVMKGNIVKLLYKLSKKIGIFKFCFVVEGLWGIKMYFILYVLFLICLLINLFYVFFNGGENKINKVYVYCIYCVIV